MKRSWVVAMTIKRAMKRMGAATITRNWMMSVRVFSISRIKNDVS